MQRRVQPCTGCVQVDFNEQLSDVSSSSVRAKTAEFQIARDGLDASIGVLAYNNICSMQGMWGRNGILERGETLRSVRRILLSPWLPTVLLSPHHPPN